MTKNFSAAWKILLTSALAVGLTACGQQGEGIPADDTSIVDAIAPNTGNEVLEEQDKNPSPLMSAPDGKALYVYGSQVRARSTPEIKPDNILGFLIENDEVIVIDKTEIGGDRFVLVKVKKSARPLTPSETVYVSMNYLTDKPVVVRAGVTNAGTARSDVFVIQNLATEIMRVYKRNCNDGQCSHQLLMETEIAVGEKKPGTMTVLGNFHYNKWIKFYEDGGGLYPSWFDPMYPPVPRPGAGVTSWTSKKVLPKGNVRGAFGWYTAFPGPDSHNQWTHGTLGWGADGNKYIKATRGFWANLFTDPRSHGCTRTDNESIAYFRTLVPVGTPIMKIYAKEAYLDPARSGYSKDKKSWSYILTKNGVRVDGQVADREKVLAAGTPKEQWLEEGSYDVDAYPDAEKFSERGNGRRGKNGNVYGLKESEMQGAFLVDAGLLVNYKHPSSLARGGYKDLLAPAFVVSQAPISLP